MFLFTKENALSSDICNRFIDTFEKSDLKRPGALYGSTGLDQGSSKKVSTDISTVSKTVKLVRTDNNIWLTKSEFQEFLLDKNLFKIYLGLIYQEAKMKDDKNQ